MGGVAGEEGPPVLPPVGDAGLERVDGVTLDARVARVHVPRLEQLPRGAPPRPSSSSDSSGRRMNSHRRRPGPARHRGGRPGRIADLEVDRIEHPRLVEDHVDDQPVVEEARGRRRRCRAARARSSSRRRTRRRSGRGPGHRRRSRATTWSSSCSSASTATPRRISIVGSASARASSSASSSGWQNIDENGQPGRAGADATEAQQRRARRVAPLVHLGRLGHGAELVADAARLEEAADLVVEVHRTRQRVRRGPLLEDDDGPSELGEQDREHEPRRPGADDRDVAVDRGRRLDRAHGRAAAGGPRR